MTRLSIEQALRGLQRFLEREWSLALPIALAFLALPPLVLSLAMPQMMREVPATMEGMRALGAALPGWVLPAFFAAGLVTVTGALALMALALVPRISVAEAIQLALRRLPLWIGACLIAGGALFAALIIVGLLVGSLATGPSLLVIVTMIGLTVVSLYLVLLMPLIVERGVGPVVALRTGYQLYRGSWWRLVAGLVLFLVACWIVATALQLALGSVLLIAARASGAAELARGLLALLAALVSALEWGAFYLFVAQLYRQHAARA